MESIDLIRENLKRSRDGVLLGIEEMREHCTVFPTPKGGCHTLWVLGHLAYIEALVICTFMLGQKNPLLEWEEMFDGEPRRESSQYPPFDHVLTQCRGVRESTLNLLDTFVEEDLDRVSRKVPGGYEDIFGTYRWSLQYASDHWYMHRGHLADARRACGRKRIWV